MDELVKTLRCCGSEDRCKGCPRENDKGKCYDDICIEAADAIEELRQQVEHYHWISVKERLPEDSWTRVLVYTNERQIQTIPACKVGRGYVSHWMPLPEPPEEE